MDESDALRAVRVNPNRKVVLKDAKMLYRPEGNCSYILYVIMYQYKLSDMNIQCGLGFTTFFT